VGLEAAVCAEAERRFGDDARVTLELRVEALPQPPSPDTAIGCLRILELIFDSITAVPDLARLTVSLQGLDSSRFVARVHATSGGQAWTDPQWALLPQAMAASLDGAVCIDGGDAAQTVSMVLPYRHGGDGSTARAATSNTGPAPA
jgi:hypothetical protein